jgi:hypothetical protein
MRHQMHMKRFGLFILVLLAALSASAQTTSLDGKWNIEWLRLDGTSYTPRNKQPITLTVADVIVGGTYVNDENEACDVRGTFIGRGIEFTVQCSAWRIDFMGDVSNDNQTINGTYTVPPGGKYVNGTHGYFRADRNTCFLPEGCGK